MVPPTLRSDGTEDFPTTALNASAAGGRAAMSSPRDGERENDPPLLAGEVVYGHQR
jgi:hypothetical protein